MAKIKQIGGNPKEISHDAKDVLIWLKCLENKSHTSYLITPYDVTQNKLGCPICEGRELIIPYQIRCGLKLYDDNSSDGVVFGSNGYFITIKETKDEAIDIFYKTIKEMFPDAEHGELIMVSDLKCDCGCNMESAKYEDGTELIGRMDGMFDRGEFYVEIVNTQQS